MKSSNPNNEMIVNKLEFTAFSFASSLELAVVPVPGPTVQDKIRKGGWVELSAVGVESC